LPTTLKEDHAANDTVVKQLASHENVMLQSYHTDQAMTNKLQNLKGAEFTNAFLQNEAQDHRKALHAFEEACNQVEDRDMKLYLDETIPVVRAHLEVI
jgi:putative membrane protein